MQRTISRLTQQVRDLKSSRDHHIKLSAELVRAARMAKLFLEGEALPTREQLLKVLDSAIAKATGSAA